MTKKQTGKWLGILAIWLWTTSALAAPLAVPYNGYLTDADGNGFDGNVSVTAELYETFEGGEPVTTCMWPSLEVQAGVLSFVMGADCTPPLESAMFLPDGMYLAITINGTTLEPRQEILSTAYALAAEDSANLGGYPAEDYMLKQNTAEVCESGDYADLSGTPDLSGYALTADLQGVCFSGSYQDLTGTPDLTGFVTQEELATVATTGSYADLTSTPDLSVYAMLADLATVAVTGNYADLTGTPDLSVYLKADGSVALAGSWDLARHRLLNLAVDDSESAPGSPVAGQLWWDADGATLRVWTGTEWLGLGSGASSLPNNALSTVSNGTLTNELEKPYAATGLPTGIGVSQDASLEIANSGSLTDLTLSFHLTHPFCSELSIRLLPPGDDQGILLVAAGDITGQVYNEEFGLADELPAGGTLQGLLGTEQSGTWLLRVTDTVQNGNEGPGQIESFQMTTQYLASGQVQVNGTLSVNGEDVGSQLTAHSTQLEALQGEIWCLKHCDPAKIGDCKDRLCDGIAQSCVESGALPDGTVCQGGAGTCQSGECCVPLSCAILGFNCGETADGCGGTVQCGSCQDPDAVCFENQCCVPETCEWLGYECGEWDDGCGDTVQCADCTNGYSCGETGFCDGPWVGIDCGGVTCPELAGYDLTCNAQNHCEYAYPDTSDWRQWDVWIYIPPGSFEMGSPASESTNADEKPVHTVTISYGYFIAKYEVVVPQYEACIGDGTCTEGSTADWDGNGWGLNTTENGHWDHPQNGITWQQAKDFCGWVAPQGRLPSEAEWEYSATGPSHLKYPWGDTPAPTCLNNTAVFNEADDTGGYGCSEGGTWTVGSKPDGASWCGALDMSGNLWEWNEDWYHDSYTDAPADGSAWVEPTGSARVLRGGSFHHDAASVRSAERRSTTPSARYADYGARCLRPLP